MIKWLLIIGGSIAGLILVILLIGWMLPKKHQAIRSQVFTASTNALWKYIYDFAGYASWRSGLKEVKVLTEDSWEELDNRNDRITLKIVEAIPDKKLVTRIIDEKLPFGGSWTFELSEKEGQTQLTITENGEIYHPVFRFFAHFIFGYEATIKQYLEDLENAIHKT